MHNDCRRKGANIHTTKKLIPYTSPYLFIHILFSILISSFITLFKIFSICSSIFIIFILIGERTLRKYTITANIIIIINKITSWMPNIIHLTSFFVLEKRTPRKYIASDKIPINTKPTIITNAMILLLIPKAM